jgi:hypothetical protein
MSSLQKFHRRTNAPVVAGQFPTIGSGNNTIGYWVGTAGDGISKLILAPAPVRGSTIFWGSAGVLRGVTNNNDGLANTNTLYSFGSAAHPMAYYHKSQTTGGYNTWYLPAINELLTLYSNKSKMGSAWAWPAGNGLVSSTEINADFAKIINESGQVSGVSGGYNYWKNGGSYYSTAVRRSTI